MTNGKTIKPTASPVIVQMETHLRAGRALRLDKETGVDLKR